MAKRILTVDDSKTMREMVAFTLQGAGYEILQAEDGVLALKLLEGNKVDLVITDLNMPNMDGITLIKALRQNPLYKNAPILMLTTESDNNKKSEGKNAGATGWIVKPFNPEKLIQVVNKVLP
ncbi:MAG: response regulator [Alphaproteobacteria bacterium]